MTLKNIIVTIKSDPIKRRWKVIEAETLKAVMAAISSARVTGSIGHTNIIDETYIGGTKRVVAHVIEVHSDNTERVAYDTRY